jgi:hypothetical protein
MAGVGKRRLKHVRSTLETVPLDLQGWYSIKPKHQMMVNMATGIEINKILDKSKHVL